jgi:hypothetical protein
MERLFHKLVSSGEIIARRVLLVSRRVTDRLNLVFHYPDKSNGLAVVVCLFVCLCLLLFLYFVLLNCADRSLLFLLVKKSKSKS